MVEGQDRIPFIERVTGTFFYSFFFSSLFFLSFFLFFYFLFSSFIFFSHLPITVADVNELHKAQYRFSFHSPFPPFSS